MQRKLQEVGKSAVRSRDPEVLCHGLLYVPHYSMKREWFRAGVELGSASCLTVVSNTEYLLSICPL